MACLKSNGRIIICGIIRALAGLHIGSLNPGLQVGGIDLPVVRNPLDNRPFLPGSSLRGKMRSLLERHFGLPLNRKIQEEPPVRIHECETEEEYKRCLVCNIFGVAVDVAEKYENLPSRLIVRDALLSDFSADELQKRKTDLPYTEAKMEIAVDRITAQAVPRTVERVPAGAFFNFEMVFNLLKEDDQNFFKDVLLGMRLLEDDYLGGHGARGSGKVRFENVSVSLRHPGYYEGKEPEKEMAKNQTVACLQAINWVEKINEILKEEISGGSDG